MAVIWAKRAFLALGGFLMTAALLDAVQARVEPQPVHASLVGQLLIASPNIGDPRFRQTVILIVQHNKDGALGITLNRPAGEYSLARLLESIGENGAAAQGNVKVFSGGPVQPQAAFAVHTAEYSRAGTIVINEFVAATSSKEIFRDIAQNKGPRKTLIAFGYAGWGPNQLEAEMASDSWYTAIAAPALVFDESRERLWETAMERRLHDL